MKTKSAKLAAAAAFGVLAASCGSTGFGGLVGSQPTMADVQAENARLIETLAATEAERDALAEQIAELEAQLTALQDELDLARGVRR